MHFLEEFPFVKLGTVQKRNMEASKTKLVLVWVCNERRQYSLLGRPWREGHVYSAEGE